MNHRIGRKRVAGIFGVLAALSITASGCSLVPGLGNSAELPKGQIASYDPSQVAADSEFQAAFGINPEWTKDIAKSGLSILSIVFEAYPDYTVEGFVPTQDDWNAVLNKIAPLTTSSATEYVNSKWYEDKTMPVVTSYRTALEADGSRSYTSTTAAGEKCTASAKPYSANLDTARVTAKHDETTGANTPMFIADVSLTIHCKEGGTYSGLMRTSIPMKQEDGWRMHTGALSEPVGEFVMAK